MKGSVVVLPFPFSDLSGSKRRPALVLTDRGGADVILCQITSKSKNDGLEVDLGDAHFMEGRLPVPSNIRPNKIFTADKRTILRVVGKLRPEKFSQVAQRVIDLVR